MKEDAQLLIAAAVIIVAVILISFVKQFETNPMSNELSCSSDADCACGVHVDTNQCFYGNRNYVNTNKICPDFCTGITGHLEIKCNRGKCVQE